MKDDLLIWMEWQAEPLIFFQLEFANANEVGRGILYITTIFSLHAINANVLGQTETVLSVFYKIK